MSIPNTRPLHTHGMNIDDLYAEAAAWLDGTPIENEGQAAEVGKLRDMIRDAEKAAKAAKAEEREPHASQVKAIDADWKPVLEKADWAKNACNSALAPYLAAKEASQREAAEAARAEAQRIAAEAQAARQAASPDNLDARRVAEEMLKAAKDADKQATKLEKVKTQVAGANRAIGLRSSFTAALTDSMAALKYYREHQPDALKAWLTEQAQRDVNAGARAIPGFTITEERKAA